MSKKNTADQSFLRELNISTVLRNIHTNAPISRARLASRTGLNKSTISSLVEELLEFRLIHETGINSIGTGRPSTLLEINPQAGCIIGVELGVDFVATALTDFVGNVLWRYMANADPAAGPEIDPGSDPGSGKRRNRSQSPNRSAAVRDRRRHPWDG